MIAQREAREEEVVGALTKVPPDDLGTDGDQPFGNDSFEVNESVLDELIDLVIAEHWRGHASF